MSMDDLVVYQIYPKSFCDSNADGVGDLQGIIQKLDYLADLGVTMIWLNPIFLSPQIDNGYDISDYYQIDSIFGDMTDMQSLLEKAHAKGIKVIFDLVLNHTSDQHYWFLEAKKGQDNPYRDYYIWKNPHKETGKEPNNWASFFGGSTWELIDNQYYFHLFAKEMPDLNWHNPKVRQEMVDIAKFWLAKGVDGFRVDAFIHIAKQMDFPNMPFVKDSHEPFVLAEQYYANLPEIKIFMIEFVQEIRKDYPDAYFVGEAASATAELGYRYTNQKDGFFDSVITFRYLVDKPTDALQPYQKSYFDMVTLKANVMEWQQLLAQDNPMVLYWSNHDMPRILDKFKFPQDKRYDMATLLATLMYLQRGIPFIYYGEEIGMQNFQLKWEDIVDPKEQQLIALANQKGSLQDEVLHQISYKRRDTARGMMQWQKNTSRGWIRANREMEFNVAEQQNLTKSILNYYKQLLRLRRQAVFVQGSWYLEETSDELYIYTREHANEKVTVLCNLSDQEQNFKCDGTVLLSNLQRQTYDGKLHPYEALVVQERI